MKIYLAPMEGVVDYVIRDLFSAIGGFDQMVTEFVRVTNQLLPAHVFYRYCPELYNQGKTRSGTPVYVQLLGGDPACLADNATLACQLGAPGIDLNFGCPAKTVNRHDGGAALLKNPSRLFDVIRAVKAAVPVTTPVSAKVRLGFEDKSLVKEIARAVEEAKAEKIVIHARTKKEGYKPPAHWEFIAHMKEELTIPTVANGDIWTVEDYFRCREISTCEDVALGRTAFARPDLALQIKAELSTTSLKHAPMSIGNASSFLTCSSFLTWDDLIKEWLPRFFQDSNVLGGEYYAVCRLKQWSKFLGRSYPQATDFFNLIKRQQTYSDLEQSLRMRE